MACLPYGRGPGPVHGIRIPPSAAGIRRCGLAAVLATLLAGCAGSALLPSGAEDHGNPGLRLTAIELLNRQTPITEPTRRALEALSRGQFSSANQHFSLALGRDSRNAALHAMNALTYHLRVRQGERDLLELAETGYLVSLEQRRDFLPSALQLTRLYLENGRFEEAKRAAIYALDLEPDSDEALQLLAAAAYYDGDVELSLWAIEEARSLKPADRRLATMRPLIYGAAGLDDEARRALQDTAAAGLLDDRRQARLQRRLDQWRGLYQEAQATDQAPASSSGVPAAAPRGDVTSTPAAPVNPLQQYLTPANSAASRGADGQSRPDGPYDYAWWDCQQQLNTSVTGSSFSSGSSYSSYGYGSSSADETTALPALPAPCRGRPLPRMAMFDAVMLRTDDVRSSGYGVNLLDNLTGFLSLSVSKEKNWGTSPTTIENTLNRGLGLGTGPSGVLAYSLNIANAADERAEILARPSLLALDRQAAQFFSGSTVSVALVSNEGGGNLQDKPVGVSLSVTPTFIDDDSMLVSVKAVRSFFEETAATATFQESVQTSRNMVTANVRLRFNETLILSGLSEREITSMNSRTPFLGELPGLQYLFSRRDSQDFTRSVIIMLTPRRVASLNETLAGLDTAAASEAGRNPALVREMRRKALAELGGIWPNLSVTLRHMDRNRLFRAVRSGDLEMEDWERPDRIESLLTDLVGLLYH